MRTYGVTYRLYVEVEAESEEQAQELADKDINDAIRDNELHGYLCEDTDIEEIYQEED